MARSDLEISSSDPPGKYRPSEYFIVSLVTENTQFDKLRLKMFFKIEQKNRAMKTLLQLNACLAACNG